MREKITMIFWKSGKFGIGRLRENPGIMTQGRTLKELGENIRDAYRLMTMDEIPENYSVKEIAVGNDADWSGASRKAVACC
jgi:predicted RNase H-like HicB family nuclease